MPFDSAPSSPCLKAGAPGAVFGGMDRYPAIRLWTRIALTLSWIVAGAIALLALITFLGMAGNGGGAALVGFVEFLVGLVFAGLVWLGMRVLPEVLTAIVAIEANTRRPPDAP